MSEPISGARLRQKSRPLVTCPDTGNTYRMRRCTMTDLINSNALPENFVAQTLQEMGKEVKGQKLTDKDLLNAEATQQAMITACMLEPRIVEHATADDEIEYKDVPPSDRAYLFKWTKGELPDVVIETDTGVTTVSAVETFPSRGESFSPQSNGTERQQGTSAVSGAA